MVHSISALLECPKPLKLSRLDMNIAQYRVAAAGVEDDL
jgi:hypothetical protein